MVCTNCPIVVSVLANKVGEILVHVEVSFESRDPIALQYHLPATGSYDIGSQHGKFTSLGR